MLLNSGVPFEPNVLLDKNWRDHLKNFSGFFSGLSTRRLGETFSGGAVVAETLILPEKVEIKGDTVFLADRIFFEGKNVEIRSQGKKIAIFPVTEISGTKSRNGVDHSAFEKYKTDPLLMDFWGVREKASDATYKISSRGFGYDDWLRSRGVKSDDFPLYRFPYLTPCSDGSISCDPDPAQHGTPGLPGNSRPVAESGNDSPDPIDGTCILSGNPNGQNTPDAKHGQNALSGGNAPNPGQAGGPTAGGDAGAIFCSIPDGSAGHWYFDATGGIGGSGGPGGTGGIGGNGGQGKRGGDGVTCGTTVGNGGNAGRGGNAGDAGAGGNGANGAKGGNAADITIDHPQGVIVYATANKGPGGQGGPAGLPGNPGVPGSGARGGLPGPTVGGVYGNYGSASQAGDFGDQKTEGQPGNNGPEGDYEGVLM
jgi:hypothetical protein